MSWLQKSALEFNLLHHTHKCSSFGKRVRGWMGGGKELQTLRNLQKYECNLCVLQKNSSKEELKHKPLLRSLSDLSLGLYVGLREHLHVC